MRAIPYAARRLIFSTEGGAALRRACSEIHRSSSGCTPKVRRDLAYFGQPHLEKPRPNRDGAKVGRQRRRCETGIPDSGRGAAENKPLGRSFVMMTPAWTSEARPRTSLAERDE